MLWSIFLINFFINNYHCRLKYNMNVTARGITNMKIIIADTHVIGLSLSMNPKKAFRFLFI